MYQIKDRLGVQLLFDDKEFPFERTNGLDFLHMSSSTRIGVPMIHVGVSDALGWLKEQQVLVDGTKIKVVIHQEGSPKTYKFRVNTFKEPLEGGVPKYEIDGYLDYPLYWLSSGVKPISGTSDEALKQVAAVCGIQDYSGTPTADSQIWYPSNTKFFKFAAKIAERGYISATSGMQLGLDLSGTLLYKNIAEDVPVRARFVRGRYSNDSFLASDFELINKSGMYNALSGYASKMVAQDGTGVDAVIENVQVTRLTSKMMMNSRIHNAVSQARVDIRPIDCGNSHPQYEQALYQNRRIANTFMVGGNLITPVVTDVRLMDVIAFLDDVPSGQTVRATSGNYRVVSKSVYVSGANYFEKLGMARHGMNINSETQIG
jgi:hypothetical protein